MARTGYQIAYDRTHAALEADMGLQRYRNKRDESEKAIVDTLIACGCSVIRTDKPLDLIIGYRGQTYLAECKTPGTRYGKQLNEAQTRFAETWRGSPIITLRTPDDALEFVNGRCFS